MPQASAKTVRPTASAASTPPNAVPASLRHTSAVVSLVLFAQAPNITPEVPVLLVRRPARPAQGQPPAAPRAPSANGLTMECAVPALRDAPTARVRANASTAQGTLFCREVSASLALQATTSIKPLDFASAAHQAASPVICRRLSAPAATRLSCSNLAPASTAPTELCGAQQMPNAFPARHPASLAAEPRRIAHPAQISPL